jgi:hypothetical protein
MAMMPYDCPWSSLQLTGRADFWHPTGAQDVLMQYPQPRAGVGAKLAGQLLPGLLEPAKRLGLAPAPVQRQHQLADQPLIGRGGGGLPGQLADQGSVLAQPQPGLVLIQHGRGPFTSSTWRIAHSHGLSSPASAGPRHSPSASRSRANAD